MDARAEPDALPEPTDPPVRVIDVLGTRMGCASEGSESGPAILTVHGVPGGAHDFRYLSPLLATRARVHRLELPGFGVVRDATWRDWSHAGRGRLVVGAADALGLDRFAVVGHSMGGAATLAAAHAAPDRVTALAFLASIGVSRHRSMVLPKAGALTLRALLAVPGLRDRLAARMRAAYRRWRFPNTDALTVSELRTHLAIIAGVDFAFARRAAAAVGCPTLVAFADDDPQLEPAIGAELAEVIPTATAVRYDQGGHNIQKTRALDLAPRILALLGA